MALPRNAGFTPPEIERKKPTMQKELTKEDWQWLAYVAQRHFNEQRPKTGEPPASAESKAEETRIMYYLLEKAYSNPTPPA